MKLIILIAIILVPSLITIPIIYFPAFEYSNYLYWQSHARMASPCKPDTECSSTIDTGSICVHSYRNADPSFNQMCTTARWDGPYWIIQVTSLLLSLISTFVSIVILSILYFKRKKIRSLQQ
ncbi:MAG: hypothetical protein KGI09_06120 [Thaumarchaeota archaeon]|nr:hypothetical protein [Nitrososphaerota archaeon]